ncbi:hypothetical protein EBR21_14410 [bacterium]|nr:hypothetical protein [bacterium]
MRHVVGLSLLVISVLGACKPVDKSSSEESGAVQSVGVYGDVSRVWPGVEKALSSYVIKSRPQGQTVAFGITKHSERWTRNPFKYLIQFAGMLVGYQFGTSEFEYQWNGKAAKGSADFGFQPQAGHVLDKSGCFTVELWRIQMPEHGIDTGLVSSLADDKKSLRNAAQVDVCPNKK